MFGVFLGVVKRHEEARAYSIYTQSTSEPKSDFIDEEYAITAITVCPITLELPNDDATCERIQHTTKSIAQRTTHIFTSLVTVVYQIQRRIHTYLYQHTPTTDS